MTATLPIDTVLPALRDALRDAGRVVLMAPPGAGKTTRVPLALLPDVTGRIVMLEPRRLAARAAAERMAATLGEVPGKTVGYRIRGQSCPGSRVEVVTEGILTRMIQSDPGLDGIGCLIFDEFHERSLNADLGLALAWQARGLLRPDLGIVVMSATLDAEPVAALLDGAPVIRSEGRAFPVETRWLDRPLPPGQRFDRAMAALITDAVAAEPGDVLAFLPGEAEIRRVAALLDLLGVAIRPLYGALPFADQRAAIEPGQGRRVVLATSIAETSLTIQGVRIVVDGGRARRARFDPGSGLTRLVTERVSRAEAVQRQGRAGRMEPGTCYRLWTRGEEGALPAFAPPEMLTADLTPLALELAVWGAEADDLAFLTPPPAPALTEARALLAELGALDDAGRITAHGRALAGLPLHPRLAHMLLIAGPAAAPLAALIEARDPLRGAGADLAARLRALPPAIQDEARRLKRLAPASTASLSPAQMAALAYPDRIAQRRDGSTNRYLLSGGKGAVIDEADPLAASPLLVVTDTDGDPREARIRLALPLSEAELRAVLGDRMAVETLCDWDVRAGRILTRRRERLGVLVLSDAHWPDAPPEDQARAALIGLRAQGLRWSDAARRLAARVAAVNAGGAGLPDLSEAAVLADETALLPHLKGRRTAADLASLDLVAVLRDRLGWDGVGALDRLAPAHVTTPLGRKLAIDYDAETPTISVRLQELFGLTRHPMIGNRPLRIELLSPGHKPIAVTTDLPSFWAGSYVDVRKDMRGRYPRHPWPENPAEADPTTRAKPRGS
ncbi:ATP-dependent helicase HrpB [Paracoccus sp. p3-h83]|uniref:ATP-dependent helicase HrpB n=1 Tax=Paracoccus sp. p3-h83 TaxID=3342805 RepID=UPI0035B9192C